MKIVSTDDIRIYFKEHPLPKDINNTSRYVQRKVVDEICRVYYETVIKWFFPSVRLDGIIAKEAKGVFLNHINDIDGNVKEMLLEKISKINDHYLSKTIDRMYDRIVSNGKINSTLLLNIGLLLYNGDTEVAEDLETKYNELFDKLIERDVKYLKYYRGDDLYYYETALESKKVSVSSIIYASTRLSKEKKIELYCELLKEDYKTVAESEFLEETTGILHDNCYLLIKQMLTSKDYKNKNLIRLIKNRDYRYISTILRELREERPLRITIDTINYLYAREIIKLRDYNDTFGSLMGDDITTLKKYIGDVIPADLINTLTNNCVFDGKIADALTKAYLSKSPNFSKILYNSIFKIIVSSNPQLIDYYYGKTFDVIKVALEHGATVTTQSLVKDFLLWEDPKPSVEDIEYIFNYLGIKPIDINALRNYGYKNDAVRLLSHFDKVDYILEVLHIDRDIFFQWAFASNKPWLNYILIIFDQNKVTEFSKVYNKFMKCYYNINEKTPNILRVRAFLDVLGNYSTYPELCDSIIDDDLNEEDIDRLRTLFSNPVVTFKKNYEPITNKRELYDIDNMLLKKYQTKVAGLTEFENSELRKVFCEIMFNMSYTDVRTKVSETCSFKRLRQMLFDNRDNKELFGDILEMMTYAALLEDVSNCSQPKDILKILNAILKNPETFKLCLRCRQLFASVDEKMKRLYANELSANLTNLSNIPKELINQGFTEKYGIETIDLSNSKFLLAYHTVKYIKEIEELVNGVASGEKPTVSVSLAGSRNQLLYSDYNTIVATDTVPEELFILTSIENMNSNGCVERYDCNIETDHLRIWSHDAYETSTAYTGDNSEVICCREGLKFKYIILPDAREPRKEEIEAAKKYGMKFVITQKLNKSVLNPKPIPKLNEKKNIESMPSHREELSKIREVLLNNKTKKPRRIAIFADPHGLFEPTLASFEDMRMQGITEIYSLGDNIGFGPNPKEVMDLLEEYNVKSLRGEHELYALGLIDTVKDYVEWSGKCDDIIRNSQWTRNQLTEEQIERIKSFPEKKIIKIGSKKIMLSHYMKDYNTGERLIIPSGVSKVFQGHLHMEDFDSRISTVPSAGVELEHSGHPSYIIIEEQPDGRYNISERATSFNTKQTLCDIIESDLPEPDKEIIADLVVGSKY